MTMNNDLNFADLYKEASTVLKGDFDVIFVKAEAASSSNGKPMIKYQAAVEGGPSHGHIFYGQSTISRESSAALRIFFSQMEAIGLNAVFFAQVPAGDAGLAMIAAEMVGKRALFTVEGREWQGVERESVQSIRSPRLSGPLPGGMSMASPSGVPTPTSVPSPTPAGPPVPTPAAAPTVPTTPPVPTPQTPAPAATPAVPAPPTTPVVTPATPAADAPPTLPY